MNCCNGSIIYSNTQLTSVANTVSTNGHTSCIYIMNNDANTNAVVELNEGPHTVLIPHAGKNHQYVHIPGDYTKIRVITTDVTLSVYAIG